jgi:hypothetical protein
MATDVPEPYWNRTGTSKTVFSLDFSVNLLVFDVPERCRNRTGTVLEPYWNRTGTAAGGLASTYMEGEGTASISQTIFRKFL